MVISVTERKGSTSDRNAKVKMDDLVVFSRQLATMVDSGIPLIKGLSTLAGQVKSKTLRKIIARIRDDVETGSSLSEALSKHPKVFSPLYVNMVTAGESSGMLDDMLERVAAYLEKSNALKRKVKSALTYPAAVCSMATLISAFLILKVVPGFKDIFSTLGAKLPAPTAALIALSDILRHYFLSVVIGVVIVVTVVTKYLKTSKGRLRFDKLKLKLLIFGPLFQKIAIARFSRTLATLLKSDVPILTSLEIVGKTCGNKALEVALEEAATNVREGEHITEPLRRDKIFPPMVVDMISVGEESGELEAMLNKIADFYEDEVDTAISGLTSLIEPVVIAFMGIVIGSVVVAMFLPIFQLTRIVGG